MATAYGWTGLKHQAVGTSSISEQLGLKSKPSPLKSMWLVPCMLAAFAVLGSAETTFQERLLNEYAVHIPDGNEVAELVARSNDLQIVHRIPTLDLYVLSHKAKEGGRKKRTARSVLSRLNSDPNVRSAHQEKTLNRLHRGPLPMESETTHRDKRYIVHNKGLTLGISNRDYQELERKHEEYYKNQARDFSPSLMNFNDPMWPRQWYLENRGQNGGHTGRDLNVIPAWQCMNLTGRGVKVLVLDDGVDHSHPDIKENFNMAISADFNNRTSSGLVDGDPMPNVNNSDNGHGTRCAGEIAAVANNGVCGVGVAFKASVGGIRILDGKVTDSMEAEALTHKINEVDIFSASWGPPDDGSVMEGPGPHCERALKKTAEEGRGGKGCIFVWATGNGGMRNDTCSCDGYVGSIYTISIGSTTEEGTRSYFSEVCPSTMAVVYTGGTHKMGEQTGAKTQVVTTDINNGCISSFQGTSAAAPLAAGCFALVLESNPNLTYRDINYLLVKTSLIPHNEPNYISNGAGFRYHPSYGFGTIDCSAMSAEAKGWKTVPELAKDSFEAEDEEIEVPFGGCQSSRIQIRDTAIKHLEHVDLMIDINTARRGDIGINLISPSHTDSRMLELRAHDSKENIKFIFNTVINWGEDPHGEWMLKVCSMEAQSRDQAEAVIVKWALNIYGIKEDDPNDIPQQRDITFGPSHKMSPTEVEQIMVRQEEVKQSYNCLNSASMTTAMPPGQLDNDADFSPEELDEALRLLQEVAEQIKRENSQEAYRSTDEEIYRAASNIRDYLQGY